MKYSLSNIQRANESGDQFSSEAWSPHSLTWYQFILSTAIVYYTMAVLSMVFTKESRRLREISLLHDNLVMFIVLPSLVEWFSSVTYNSTWFVNHSATHQKFQFPMSTCWSIVFLHSSLQASFVFALIYTIYAENILLPGMASIKPKPILTMRLLVVQVVTGLIVATTMALIDISTKEGSNRCPLQTSLKKTVDITFDFSIIYATFILLSVAIDKFLKVVVIACHRTSTKTAKELHFDY